VDCSFSDVLEALGPVALAERNALGHIAVVGSGCKDLLFSFSFFFFFFFPFLQNPARPEFNQRRVCVVGADGAVISSRQFKTPVLSVVFSSKGHIAVVTSDCIYWFKYLEKEAVKCVPTCVNLEALCAISDDGHLLAFPLGPNLIGVWHGNEEMVQIATTGGISKLRFNPKGAGQDLLAATSEGGKTLWVWALNRIDKKAVLRFEFSRSRKNSQVQGLDFNSMSTLLALSADSGTVHVFELSETNAVSSSGGIFGSVTSWIPSVVVPSISSKYQLRLKTRGPALACVMVVELPEDEETSSRSVYVLTSNGNLSEYTLPASTSSVLENDLPLRILKVFA
jgi:WD40 repeat protein